MAAEAVLLEQRQDVFGEIDFGQQDGNPMTIRAYPIGQVDTGEAINEIEGAVSAFKDFNGNAINLAGLDDGARAAAIQRICSGSFTLQSGTDLTYGGPLPGDFPTSGRFLVFRR